MTAAPTSKPPGHRRRGRPAGRRRQDQRCADPGGAQRLRDRPGQRLHPDQRHPRGAVRHRAVDRLGDQRAFGLLIIANSAIGIIQELRAKQTLDKLAIVGQAKPLVRRDPARRRCCPARSCSTTSSSWARAIRSSSTARSSRKPTSRSTSRCSPARPTRSPRTPATTVMSGQLRGRRQRRLPGHQGRPRGLRRQARRGGQQVHAGEIRTAQRHQQDPAVHHLPAGPGRRC